MGITWERILAWRARRQLLERTDGVDSVAVVRRLCGVQAQVASSAEQAVLARLASPEPNLMAKAVSGRKLVKTWAMRGTLHLLPSDDAGAYLALLAAARTWEKASWQKTFLDARTMRLVAEVAAEALEGSVLSREDLTAAIVARAKDSSLAEQLSSGWGAALKPLAWQGFLCFGPSNGNRVTFTRPDTYLPGWTGLPDVDEAAAYAIPAYLGAYGPASDATFDEWILRGATKRSVLRGWFSALQASGAIVKVEVDGESLYARAEDVDEIAATRGRAPVRLLPAFDQYVLGPGTKDPHILDPVRRKYISKAAGRISPVVIAEGRIVGTWDAGKDAVEVVLFSEAPAVARKALQEELDHLGIATPLRVTTG
jgi:hypothetical protein